MGRLIDADDLIEEIKTLQVSVTGLRAGKGILAEYAKQYRESILRVIDEQPTAYDAEKVVAELEEEQNNLETDMWAKENNNWYGQYCNGMSEGYENAINKVKRGGVNE